VPCLCACSRAWLAVTVFSSDDEAAGLRCFRPLLFCSLRAEIVASACANFSFSSSTMSLVVDLTESAIGTGTVVGAASGSRVVSCLTAGSTGGLWLTMVVSSCGEEYDGGGTSGVASILEVEDVRLEL